MTRALKKLAAAAWLFAGCQRRVELPADLFPADAGGGWHRVASREVPASEAPDPVPRNEIDRLEEGVYQGPGNLAARVYVLSSAGVGVVLSQRWRPSADTVFFHRGRFFAVVKWQTANRAALQSFIRQLEGRLGPPDPPAP